MANKSWSDIVEAFLYGPTLTPVLAGCSGLLETMTPAQAFEWGVNAAKQNLQDIAVANGKEIGGPIPVAAEPTID